MAAMQVWPLAISGRKEFTMVLYFIGFGLGLSLVVFAAVSLHNPNA